ncbi:MAG: N-6 DNA methylase [Deltaproteobacteria bacterium]|nr:N-6 DNA methylase [Deltaproteobacteria bacterium]
MGVAGKPFLAEYLAGDFGAESERKLAREGIEKLYWRIREVEKEPDTYPKAKVLFDQWRILFGEVCGYDIKSPSSKIKQLGEFYGVKKDPNPAALLFAVHSYYALFMKFLAAEIATLFNPLSTSFLARIHQSGSAEKLREELRDLEDGGIYSRLGIKNFLEGDIFSWYLDAWEKKDDPDNKDIETLIRKMVSCLDEYDPKTLSIDPVESRDLFKKLYQLLFPKTVRHDLGEYYTPDWLAELVIERVGYNGNPDKRVLDPACGSGTFLVMAINKVREYANNELIPKHDLLRKILNNIVGFDLNPLAVMAARTNYLLALRELLKHGGDIEIPVYLCDSILTPAEYSELYTKEGRAAGERGKFKNLPTSAANFLIPTEVGAKREAISKYVNQLEYCVKTNLSAEEFLQRCRGDGLSITATEIHVGLFNEIVRLKKAKKNDIWARIIKNSFAPLFEGEFDYVIGNPPWIAFENLPAEYRERLDPMWIDYGLRPQKGWRGRFTKGDLEFSMLFTYACGDFYTKPEGKLAFLITQTVFQSKEAGAGFRSFHVRGARNLEVARVDDLSQLQPFPFAANRTSMFTSTVGGKKTSYPVPYHVWKAKPKKSRQIPEDLALGDILQGSVEVEEMQAESVDGGSGPWMILPKGTRKSTLDKLRVGVSPYRALEGSNTRGANTVFWLRPLKSIGKKILVENTPEFARKKTKKIQRSLEKELLYPLLRGKDVDRWIAEPELLILFAHKGDSAIPEDDVKKLSETWAYLNEFRDFLSARKMYDLGFRKLAFYALFETGKFLVADWKVVFREQAASLTAAVVGPHTSPYLDKKPVIPDHKLMVAQMESQDEAHYVCSLLNSSLSRFFAEAYFIETAISTHILDYIKVPAFTPRNALHARLSRASQEAHQLKAANKKTQLVEVEQQIDEAAAELWGITPNELVQIQKALKDG